MSGRLTFRKINSSRTERASWVLYLDGEPFGGRNSTYVYGYTEGPYRCVYRFRDIHKPDSRTRFDFDSLQEAKRFLVEHVNEHYEPDYFSEG